MNNVHRHGAGLHHEATPGKVKTKTVNAALRVVCRILNLASSVWVDEKRMIWLETAPKLELSAKAWLNEKRDYPLAGLIK